MPDPQDGQSPSGSPGPETPDPTVFIPGWPEQDTSMRPRAPGEAEALPAEYVLVVYAGAMLGRLFPLGPGVNVLGRAPGLHITLADDEVSRVHAAVTLDGSQGPGLYLEDRGSTNGTFLNDRAVTGPVRMAPGDRIAVGGHVLKLVAMDSLERAFHAVLLDQSTRDPLTGLSNRRTILEELQSWFDLSRRHQRPLAVLMCDLDHFKRINDTLGHGAGDQVLEAFGHRVKETLRATDLAGRIGGEEFLVILPETDLEGALLLAERVRAAASVPFLAGSGHLKVTCSLGVAQRGDLDQGAGTLLARADGALYAAKRAGRDQVVADPPVR
jgi:diguanylate cyclase (GGDEF)-like protein